MYATGNSCGCLPPLHPVRSRCALIITNRDFPRGINLIILGRSLGPSYPYVCTRRHPVYVHVYVWLRRCTYVSNDVYLFIRVLSVYIYSCITMLVERPNMPKAQQDVLIITNIVFSSIFLIEGFLKITALGFKIYWQSGFNKVNILKSHLLARHNFL